MDFNDIARAMADARIAQRLVDAQVHVMATLCAGKLEQAWAFHPMQDTLRRLKDELRRYNPHTNTWRD